MIKKILPIFFVLGFMLALAQEPKAQSQAEPGQSAFTEQSWQKARAGIEYKKPAVKKAQKKAPKSRQTPNWFTWDGWPMVARVLLIFIGVVVLAFLLYYILTAQPDGSKRINKRTISNYLPDEIDEEQLKTLNFEDLIGLAEEQGNWRAAFRYRYLLVLQQLDAQGFIAWKKDKTNRNYVQEVAGQPWQASLEQATLTFEQAWYGEYAFDSTQYSLQKGILENLHQRLVTQKPETRHA